MNRVRGRSSFWIWLLVIASASATMALFATREGVGLSPDSDTYLAMAGHLRSGRGFERVLDNPQSDSQPLTHYPPLYPLILRRFPCVRHHPDVRTYSFLTTAPSLALSLRPRPSRRPARDSGPRHSPRRWLA